MALPLVYSCSGCSSAAQLANHLAVRLDREGLAEMSCIAGIGGDVSSLLRKANDAIAANRPILAIDGMHPVMCRADIGKAWHHGSRHIELWRRSVRKRQHQDFKPHRIRRRTGPLQSCRG